MSQTNAIILRIDSDRTDEFEKLFESEVLPLWRKFKADGKFISASLTPVMEGEGNQGESGIRDYILHVEVPSMKEHTQFDSNPDFNRFLSKAQAMQPKEARVWLGETLFEV